MKNTLMHSSIGVSFRMQRWAVFLKEGQSFLIKDTFVKSLDFQPHQPFEGYHEKQ